VSFWGGLGIGIDLIKHRIIYILEANSNRYFEYMRDAFLFCILPPAVGLAYSIIAFAREKTLTVVLRWWLPLMVVGGFFFLWGVYGLWWTYTSYLNVIRWINAYDSVQTAVLILKVCSAVIAGHILWVYAGVLFMLMLSPRLKQRREK
jgi:FlaA1/EpsC-like NDP-sugar epimerase